MFHPRKITSSPTWLDADGIKLYTLSVHEAPVCFEKFEPRLAHVKAARALDWKNTPAFAVFHEGASCQYLILAWWGNDNELFSSVSVFNGQEWLEDPTRYSFCLYDLEVFWAERNFFIESIDCQNPSLKRYRTLRLMPGGIAE